MGTNIWGKKADFFFFFFFPEALWQNVHPSPHCFAGVLSSGHLLLSPFIICLLRDFALSSAQGKLGMSIKLAGSFKPCLCNSLQLSDCVPLQAHLQSSQINNFRAELLRTS